MVEQLLKDWWTIY